LEVFINLIRCLRDGAKDYRSNAQVGFELAKSRERAVLRLERTLSSKERDIETWRKEVDSLKATLSDCKQQQTSFKSRNSDLERKVRLVEEDYSVLKSDFHDSEQTVVELRNQNSILESEIKSGKQECNNLVKRLSETSIDLKEYEVKFMLLKESHDETLGKYESAEVKLSSQSIAIDNLEKDYEDVSAEVESLAHLNESLEKQMLKIANDLQEERQNCDREMSLTHKQILCHQKQIEELEAAIVTKVSDITILEKSHTTFIEDLELKVKEKESTIVQLSTKMRSLDSKLDTMQKEHNSISSEYTNLKVVHEETGNATKEALAKVSKLEKDYQTKCGELMYLKSDNEEKTIKINSLTDEVKVLNEDVSSQEISIGDLNNQLLNKAAVVENLNEELASRNNALTLAFSEMKKISGCRAAEKIAFEKKSASLEDTCQEAKARLAGAEKVSRVHDKECIRLLNDIESKVEQINSLKMKVKELEAEKTKLQSKTETLEKNDETKDAILKTLKEEIKNINEKHGHVTLSMTEQIESFDALLKERDEKILRVEQDIHKLSHEKEEAYMKLDNLKVELDSKDIELPLKSTPPNMGTRDIASRINSNERIYFASETKSSPSTTDIVTKHTELINDLMKMKSIVHDAITPMKEKLDESMISFDEGKGGIVSLLQAELDEKNEVLSCMEDQIDSLLRDISIAKTVLLEKDEALDIVEQQKYDLTKKMKNMHLYIKQLEDSLCIELKRRRHLDKELKSVLKEKERFKTELSEAQKALAKKSRAVEEQVDVAKQLAHQLQTTKHKIIALKSHLKHEGLLQDASTPKAGRRKESPHNSASANSQGSYSSTGTSNSICWTLSED